MDEQTSSAGRSSNRAQQTEIEQQALDLMYAHLDADVEARTAARDRILREPAQGPTGGYARDLEAHRQEERIRQLRAAEDALCFGRIDRAGRAVDEGGAAGQAGEPLHIGRIGMRSETGDILLVDWRAEAARPFYAATLASPMGVRRRRHLRVRRREVLDVSDELLDGSAPAPEDVVGDGPLVAALNGARTGRMHEAASTLQAEQDEIVRSPHRGIMVVDGGPGTGKTIVALHRAAYVLYAWPTIAGRGVLVHGPNRRFLTYISDVLPSLGENDVQLATLADLVGEEEQRTEPDHLARCKGRAELADALAQRVRAREPHGVPLELATAHDTVVLDAGTVDAARRHALQGGIGHNPARAVFTEAIVDDLVTELEARSLQEDAEFESELEKRFGIDLDRAVAGDLDRLGSGDASSADGGLDIDWDRIREDLLEDVGIERAVERVWPRLSAEDVVRGTLGDAAALTAALPDLSEADAVLLAGGADAGWTRADLALLDEARALVDGPPEEVFGHVVVDEAQQLSPMQWRVLLRRCPERSMTVVGDLAQAGPTTTIRSWEEALSPFVEDRFAHRTLTINYRTTAEILESTRPLLARIAPDQRLSQSLRHGEQPRVVRAGTGGADGQGGPEATISTLIAELRTSHPGEQIGVVTSAADASGLDSALGSTEVTVVGAPEVRGLEFDSVIIVDPSQIEAAGEAGARDLYVAQTRATQRLLSVEVREDGGPAGSFRATEPAPCAQEEEA